MKKVVFNCETCGEYLMEPHFSNSDGSFTVPKKFCPTIHQFARMFKEVHGATYFQITGAKITEVVRTVDRKLSHVNVEDYDSETVHDHSLGRYECWTDL